jgi:AcrR family transcriptional regulator
VTKQVLAADGRTIGTRAAATRRRLLDATARLLGELGVLDLRVVDITRAVGTSPATFYQYFPDVDAAILALAHEATEDERPLVSYLTPGWTLEDGLDQARTFVDAYMDYWHSHHAVLRIRNLKAEEGNAQFRAVRSEANLLVINAMQTMLRSSIEAGRLPTALDSFTAAAAMVAMIERILPFQPEMARRGADRQAVRESLSILLYRGLTGYQ